MNEKHKIVLEEMDRQVGIYDGKDKYSGTGQVTDSSLHSDGSAFYCGYSKVHRLNREKQGFNSAPSSKAIKASSRKEWKASAEAVIDELATRGYTGFIIHSVSYNGFIIQEEA